MKTDKNLNKMIRIFTVLGWVFSMTFACTAQSKSDQPQEKQVIANEEIMSYVRKVFNVPPNVSITIKDSDKPSALPGLKAIKVEFASERGTQVMEAWIGADNKTLLVGKSFDLSVDPYKQNWAKISFENAPTKGAADAKVTIVEYTDFQCPYCGNAHVTVQELLKQYDGKVKLVYKNLPLNIHNWAEDAAVAGLCVYEQKPDEFWKFSDYFFTNQKTLTKETLRAKVLELAKESNLDAEKLNSCLDAKTTLPRVQADLKEAQTLGFNSTPSFVVNGRPVVGAIKIEQFKQIVDEALAAQ